MTDKTKEQLMEELEYQKQAIEEKDAQITELTEKVNELESSVKILSEVQDRRINELNELIALNKNILASLSASVKLYEQNLNYVIEKIVK